MSFHQRLKHERLAKGWTVEQLSQASGVTVNRISMLERNLVEMVSESLMDCLAKALEVDFKAPPSPLSGTVPEPVETQPAVALPSAAPAAPVAPTPFALHLSASLQQQLEAAAHAHGRSLHGEILVRLEASLLGDVQAPAALDSAVATPAVPATARDAHGVIQLSEADLAHITAQVALRLQAPR